MKVKLKIDCFFKKILKLNNKSSQTGHKLQTFKMKMNPNKEMNFDKIEIHQNCLRRLKVIWLLRNFTNAQFL